jgi:toxin FitB
LVAAKSYAQRCVAAYGIELRDTMTAGIALARRIPIATRNLVHFEGLSVKVINPWIA